MVIITDFSFFFNAYRITKHIFFLPENYFGKQTCISPRFVVI